MKRQDMERVTFRLTGERYRQVKFFSVKDDIALQSVYEAFTLWYLDGTPSLTRTALLDRARIVQSEQREVAHA